jgi:hypothetical protein
MQDQLVTKETALLAKDKGFYWDTALGLSLREFGGYNTKISTMVGSDPIIKWDRFDSDLRMPTQSLLQKWLRDIHNINITICLSGKKYDEPSYPWDSFEQDEVFFYVIIHNKNESTTLEPYFNIYEEALEQALIESLKLI